MAYRDAGLFYFYNSRQDSKISSRSGREGTQLRIIFSTRTVCSYCTPLDNAPINAALRLSATYSGKRARYMADSEQLKSWADLTPFS
jgi:hypothetical protein